MKPVRRATIWRVLVLTALAALLLAPFLADPLEPHLVRPAARLMTFVLTGQVREHRVDEAGVPQVYYRRLGQAHPNPVYVAVYGLHYFDAWQRTGESDYFLDYYSVEVPRSLDPEVARARFLATADWLRTSLVVHTAGEVTYGLWEYGFPWAIYRLDPPWASGMAQGLGIQVLVRAWEATGDDRYLEAAILARDAFFVPMAEGGVTIMDTPTSWWFEEYADVDAVESRVFNGAAHSVIGLHELATRTNDPEAWVLYERGLRALATSLTDYDAGWWTYYDAIGLMSNYKYHRVNIGLARKVADLSGDARFDEAATLWDGYRTHFFVREFVRQRPQYVDLVVFGLSGAIAFVLLLGPVAWLVMRRRSPSGEGDVAP
jgi:hypothetical protein